MRPGVDGVEGRSGCEDRFTLERQVGNVSELVAVEFEDAAQRVLILPLASQALCNVLHVIVKNFDLGLGKKSLVGVGSDLCLVLGDLDRVVFEVVLGGRYALRQIKHFETEGLNSDDLVGVDVDLLLVAFLVRDRVSQVEFVNSLVEALRHDGCVPALTHTGGGSNLALRAKGDGSGVSSERSKRCDRFHF